MEQRDIVDIIEKAKRGDGAAKNQLVKLIQDNGYVHSISRYLYTNRLLEPDDVQSEFWMGVILALPKVNTAIGDPLYYLTWRGVNRVKSQLRKKIGKGVQAQCNECGWVGRLYRKDNSYECRKCGSKELTTRQKEINLTSLTSQSMKDNEEDKSFIDLHIHLSPPQLEIDTKIDMEYLKSKLSSRELHVFILITEENINRDHEQNYLLTIANKLGISPQCVCAYLKKIQSKMQRFFI